MQGDTTLLWLGLCGFALIFTALGAAVYFYGWRFLTFRLIGGVVGNLMGGKHSEESEENAEQTIVPPSHLGVQTAVEQLPDFHEKVAQYRNEEKLTANQSQGEDEVKPDDTFTVDPGPDPTKDDSSVRYSDNSPHRLIRDRRYKRVSGPASGHDPQVYPGMFEEDER